MYNPFSLENKTILVTGASSGIGKAIAIECSKMGAQVVITGRNEQRLQETYGQLEGAQPAYIVADLTKKEDIETLAKQIDSLNGLVNCAGISGHLLFSFLKEDDINKMFNINFFSQLYLTKEVLNKKKMTKNSSIIFITSTSGILSSYIGGSIYSATKGALNGLLKTLAIELAPKKVRVNSVMPSMIETSIMDSGNITDEQIELDKQKYPLKRYGTPKEVAYAVIYLLSDASSWTTGTNLLIDGGRSVCY
ncbi:SDR family NAD(P)-dependent oxidoreductase [Capnocytophaga sp. oral taxon 324]|uniref:SDR family NAD(P)-dependent oxidoreductase n=1 Tax=Capnocytophaga sp. oral taxon 324 TaxID=712211 RepID=UPI0002A45A05|nr:SDR family oxidoreductase [Capnocytophaga sp. oral taxon 324]EKY13138.1 oxidoreductase, short chain dehydrogenase/reductase family protein [Capnocytophaga sp. oral taxon 324 str. F0483]